MGADPPRKTYEWEDSHGSWTEHRPPVPPKPRLPGQPGWPPTARLLQREFELISILGRGGMGIVLHARDRKSGRDVALKTLLQPDKNGARRIARFWREGQVTAGLDHPGIVRIHSAGEVEGVPYLAYELVEGARSLDEVFLTCGLKERVSLIRDAARALGHAHARGIIHRDVKPDNILIDREGRVRVADFGLATAADLERLTRTNAMLGTPTHMSPEQIAPENPVGPPSDVWALGVLLYQALTGELPFQGETLIQHANLICSESPRPPSSIDPGLPPVLQAICLKALEKDPQDRFQEAEELAGYLDDYLAGRRVELVRRRSLRRGLRRHRRTLLAAATLGVAVLVPTLTWYLSRSTGKTPDDATAPQLTLKEPPPDGTWLLTRELVLEGIVEDAAATVEVRVNGKPQQPASPGQLFRLAIPLEAGENRLTVALTDPAGNTASWNISVNRPPDWFLEFPEGRRGPFPLPAEIGWGADSFVFLSDGSPLVWIPPASTDQSGFYMGKHEVSWAEYGAYCEDVGVDLPDPGGGSHEPQRPIWNVTYEDAQRYCDWAGLRLPREEEWLWAALGDDERPFPWGANPTLRPNWTLHDQWKEESGWGGGDPPLPRGSLPQGASPYGCHNMFGNVREWVLSEGVSVVGLAVQRIALGGSVWDRPEGGLRQHHLTNPGVKAPGQGFRVAFSPPVTPGSGPLLFERSYPWPPSAVRVTGLEGKLLVGLPTETPDRAFLAQWELIDWRKDETTPLNTTLESGLFALADELRSRLFYSHAERPWEVWSRELGSHENRLAVDIQHLELGFEELRMSVSPDGELAAFWSEKPAAGYGAEVVILGLPGGAELARLPHLDQASISCVAWVPGGLLVGTEGGERKDNVMALWPLDGEAPTWTDRTPLGKPESFSLIPGTDLFVLAMSSFLQVRSLQDGGLERQLKAQQPDSLMGVGQAHSLGQGVRELALGEEGVLYSFARSRSSSLERRFELAQWVPGDASALGTLLPRREYKDEVIWDLRRVRGRTYLLLAVDHTVELWDAKLLFRRAEWPSR